MIYSNHDFHQTHFMGSPEQIVDEAVSILTAIYDFAIKTNGKEDADKMIAEIGRRAVNAYKEENNG